MLKILAFPSSAKFREWLELNHEKSDGLWLRIFKKQSGKTTITYAEALDQALCHGWIDGQKRSHDADSYLQKFTPRRSRSGWSRINTGHAGRLIKAGQMRSAGLEAIAAAKKDGRWQAAYDSPRTAAPPDDFLKALEKNEKAKSFFETLNRANVYAIVYRLQTAKKPETRARRMNLILGMLDRGEKFHP
jgi:uncharacterized protein YdeI (YjbR/CyaY-like superfamily)